MTGNKNSVKMTKIVFTCFLDVWHMHSLGIGTLSMEKQKAGGIPHCIYLLSYTEGCYTRHFINQAKK